MQEFELSNGTSIPALGLGTWQLSGDVCVVSVKNAIKMGYKHIDTAEAYGNQMEIGRAIKDFDRSKLFLTSKVWRSNLKYKDVLEACKNTLRQLQTDYLDLYLIHWPNSDIPMKETFRALKKLYEEGRIKAVGVSNFTVGHLKKALDISKVPITCNQVEFHPYLYQKELLKFCKENDIQITAYSPLARGEIFKSMTVRNIADKYDKTAGQVSLRWLLQKGLVVIPKASSPEHLSENMDIFDFKLEKEDIKTLDEMGDKNKRYVDPGFAEF